jgi:hypothetical protein
MSIAVDSDMMVRLMLRQEDTGRRATVTASYDSLILSHRWDQSQK